MVNVPDQISTNTTYQASGVENLTYHQSYKHMHLARLHIDNLCPKQKDYVFFK